MKWLLNGLWVLVGLSIVGIGILVRAPANRDVLLPDAHALLGQRHRLCVLSPEPTPSFLPQPDRNAAHTAVVALYYADPKRFDVALGESVLSDGADLQQASAGALLRIFPTEVRAAALWLVRFAPTVQVPAAQRPRSGGGRVGRAGTAPSGNTAPGGGRTASSSSTRGGARAAGSGVGRAAVTGSRTAGRGGGRPTGGDGGASAAAAQAGRRARASAAEAKRIADAHAVADVAARAENMDPDNAYFHAVRAAALLAAGDWPGCRLEVANGSRLSRWDDYRNSLTNAAWQVITTATDDHDPASAAQVQLLLPGTPYGTVLRELALAYVNNASAMGAAGNPATPGVPAPSMSLRMDMFRLGGVAAERSHYIASNRLGQTLQEIVATMDQSKPPTDIGRASSSMPFRGSGPQRTLWTVSGPDLEVTIKTGAVGSALRLAGMPGDARTQRLRYATEQYTTAQLGAILVTSLMAALLFSITGLPKGEKGAVGVAPAAAIAGILSLLIAEGHLILSSLGMCSSDVELPVATAALLFLVLVLTFGFKAPMRRLLVPLMIGWGLVLTFETWQLQCTLTWGSGGILRLDNHTAYPQLLGTFLVWSTGPVVAICLATAILQRTAKYSLSAPRVAAVLCLGLALLSLAGLANVMRGQLRTGAEIGARVAGVNQLGEAQYNLKLRGQVIP